MPLNIINTAVVKGVDALPGWAYVRIYGPYVAGVAALKLFFRGTANTWERDLHGRQYLVTGGTSGLGAAVVEELASRGAHLVLLVRTVEDYWVVERIEDLRERYGNEMIYAEECDLSSLYSVRKFATKWLDNVVPRRLDGIVCCAAETMPWNKQRENTLDGVEVQMGVNYMAHYHLLTLLAPGIRSQPPDRDVRIVLTTCLTQSLGSVDPADPLQLSKRYDKPWSVFGSSKLALSLFGKEFQRRLDAVPRKDKAPSRIRVQICNPGVMRSPSTKRVLSFGSLLGLLLYVLMLPIYWIFLKSPNNGAQSILHILMNPAFEQVQGGEFISECKVYTPGRREFGDDELQKVLYDNTAKEIEKLEKVRNKAKPKPAGGVTTNIGISQVKEELFPSTIKKRNNRA